MYFGSVKFFKHLIITVLVILILLPYVTLIVFGVKYTEISKQLVNTQASVSTSSETLSKNMETMHQQLNDSIASQNTSLRDELESYITDQANEINKQTNTAINDKTNKLNESISSRIAGIQQQLKKYESEQNGIK